MKICNDMSREKREQNLEHLARRQPPMSSAVKKRVPAIRFKGFEGEWEETSASAFIRSLDAGVSVNSGDRPATKSEFGVLKTSAVTNGVFEAEENKVVSEQYEQSRLKEPVCGGTLIISRMNTSALVGASAYVESSHDNLFLPDRLWAAKPRENASMRFLAIILGSEEGRAALSKSAKGTSGSMKNITKPDVLRFPVISPALSEQQKIGNFFKQLDANLGHHQTRRADVGTLVIPAPVRLEVPSPKSGVIHSGLSSNGRVPRHSGKLLQPQK